LPITHLLKKILIISYYFPPANFVASQRPAAWAKYLHEFGYYPIVVTRNWNQNQTDLSDKIDNNQLNIERNRTHEIHQLPYHRNLRDRCTEFKWMRPIQRILTLKEMVFSNFFIAELPYNNFYTYAKELIANENIDIVLATGGPFRLFSIGHQLKNDFPEIRWIPDYRDEWSTQKGKLQENILQKWLQKLESKSELKWTANATEFISVNSSIIDNISMFIKKPGTLVMNGFETVDSGNDLVESPIKLLGDVKLLYLGTVYDNQNFSPFLDAIKQHNVSSNVKVMLNFLGSYNNEKDFTQLREFFKHFSSEIVLHPKVEKKYVSSILIESNAFVLTEYKNIDGCLPVKIFDYYQAKKPILLYPSDQGLMEEFINETKSGFVLKSKGEIQEILNRLGSTRKNEKSLLELENQEVNNIYSRHHQTKLLAETLDKLE
jgi:hypothetical protein